MYQSNFVRSWNKMILHLLNIVECNCVTAGTINNTRLCDKISGDCICKSNTEGTTCNSCKVRIRPLSFDQKKTKCMLIS